MIGTAPADVLDTALDTVADGETPKGVVLGSTMEAKPLGMDAEEAADSAGADDEAMPPLPEEAADSAGTDDETIPLAPEEAADSAGTDDEATPPAPEEAADSAGVDEEAKPLAPEETADPAGVEERGTPPPDREEAADSLADERGSMALEAGVAVADAEGFPKATMTFTSTVKAPPDTSMPVICTTIV